MNTKKTYNINNIRTLVDINENSTNFEVKFRVVSTKREPFYVVVLDQTTLDSNPNPNYQLVDKGEISGIVKQDKNEYQNFFILLKADKPCVCEVEIEKKELPKTETIIVPKHVPLPPPPKSSFSLIKLLLIFIVIAGIVYLLYLYSRKTPEKEPVHETRMRMYSPEKSNSAPEQSGEENPLLSRLKKLKL